jgi:hypothetical protein
MKTRILPALLAALLLAGCKKKGGGEPDDPTEYTLDARIPGEGSGLRGSFKIDMKINVDARDQAGKPIPEAKGMDVREEIGYRETIEKFPDGAKKPTRSRFRIDKWEKAKGDVGITKDEVMSRIVGRDILIEKQPSGIYDFRAADNGPIAHDVHIFLDKRYSDLYEGFNILDFLPGKPVRKYATWDIPIKRMTAAMGSALNVPFDQQKSKGSARLTSVFEKDGRKYGRIEMTANIVPNFPAGVSVKEAKIDLKWTLELCIDGSRHDVLATAIV